MKIQSLNLAGFLALTIGFSAAFAASTSTLDTDPKKVAGPVYGSNGSGGGHAEKTTGELLDTWENRGSEVLKPLEVVGVVETLAGVKERLPGFERDLRLALKKKWFLEPKALDKCPGGYTMFAIDEITVACQSRFNVRIVKDWFNGVGVKTQDEIAFRQLVVVVHEMVRNLNIADQGFYVDKRDEEGIRNVVRAMVPQVADEDELQHTVELGFYGHFSRGSYVVEQTRRTTEIIEGIKATHAMVLGLRPVIAGAREHLKARFLNEMAEMPKIQTEYNQLMALYDNHKISRKELLKRNDEITARWQKEKLLMADRYTAEDLAYLNEIGPKVIEINKRLDNLWRGDNRRQITDNSNLSNVAHDIKVSVIYELGAWEENEIRGWMAKKETGHLSTMLNVMRPEQVLEWEKYENQLREDDSGRNVYTAILTSEPRPKTIY